MLCCGGDNDDDDYDYGGIFGLLWWNVLNGVSTILCETFHR